MKKFLIFLWFSCLSALSPEAQIHVFENFITPDTANALIQFYDSQKTDLVNYSDNQITFSSSTPAHIRTILCNIVTQINRLMREKYNLAYNQYHVDHCGFYARIPGNYCSYHADNISFQCPIHGSDQSYLRYHCPGTCPGSKYVPNHTAWRDYTALLYLNDNFTGGEIIFEDGPANRIYKKVIPIKGGMLVMTPNNQNYYHEVPTIRSGRRYSLHFWFTTDPNHRNPVIQGQ